MLVWWTCAHCMWRTPQSSNPREIERERDRHLYDWHEGAWIEPRLLLVSHWQTVGR